MMVGIAYLQGKVLFAAGDWCATAAQALYASLRAYRDAALTHDHRRSRGRGCGRCSFFRYSTVSEPYQGGRFFFRIPVGSELYQGGFFFFRIPVGSELYQGGALMFLFIPVGSEQFQGGGFVVCTGRLCYSD